MASGPGAMPPEPGDPTNFILDVEEPLTLYVARFLRKQILDGELVPGQRIVQDAVAQQCGTSRIPVREALRELASEGLVVIEPDVGAHVRSLDSAELLEVYMMREALEPLAILSAVQHLTDEQLSTMAQHLTDSETCVNANDVAGYHHFDRMFHYSLFEAAGLHRLERVIHGLWNTAYQYQRVYTHWPQNLLASTSEHRLILDAAQRRAPDDAGQLHLLHIRRTRHALVGHPEFFKTESPAPDDEASAPKRKHKTPAAPR